MNSEAAQSAIITMGLRLGALSDWLIKHELPPVWNIAPLAVSERDYPSSLHLTVQFDSYKAANLWGWMNCKFLSSDRYGFDHRHLHATFISCPMVDFEIYLTFPAATHPDVLNPQLAHLS